MGKWTVNLIPEVATAVYMDNTSLSEIYTKKIYNINTKAGLRRN